VGPRIYRATSTNAWVVGVSVPFFETRGGEAVFAGLLVFSVDIGNFEFLAVDGQPAQDRFAVLVDARDPNNGGRILLHPYFAHDTPRELGDPDPAAARPAIARDILRRMTGDWRLVYRDPLSEAPGGSAYRGLWIAAAQPVRLPGEAAKATVQEGGTEGLVVLVQERSDVAMGPVSHLGQGLRADALLALLAMGVALVALWFFALRARSSRLDRTETPEPAPGPRPLRDRSTLSESGPSHG
jgi:hypothetical protein